MSQPAFTGKVVALDVWLQPLDNYRKYLTASGCTAGTIRIRLHHARRFSQLAARPTDITPNDLICLIARDGLEPESRKSLRASARKFFGWAFQTGLIDNDPSQALPTVRVQAGHPRPAPEMVVAAAIANAGSRTRAMLMLAAYNGLRCKEIAVVHARDIGELLTVHGKGGKVRMVPLHPIVREHLPISNGFLFPGQKDGHLSALWVCKLISKALPDGYTAHTLRHRFATAAYSADRDLLAVQQLLGHASPETTRRYTAIPDDALTKAVMAAGPAVA